MKNAKKISAFLFLLLYLGVNNIFICKTIYAAEAQSGFVVDHTSITEFDSLTSADMDGVRNLNILFGHQSVGGNIINGLDSLEVSNSMYSLAIVYCFFNGDIPSTAYDAGPRFGHLSAGTNGNPASKNTAFFGFLNTNHDKIDVAFLKYCYTDIYGTNAQTVFNDYKTAVNVFKVAHPDIKLIHCTVPLVTYFNGDNVQRNIYRNLILAEYSAAEYIYDIADLESYNNGVQTTFNYYGTTYIALNLENAFDAGHLNSEGSVMAGKALLVMLNRVAKDMIPDVTDPQINITSPTTEENYFTSVNTINISGTAYDSIGITSVTWLNDRGGNGAATGTTTWSITGITLQSGNNLITVTAGDGAGNTGTDTITVIYTPAQENNPPVLALIEDKNVDENSNLNFVISATDEDNDTLTYSAAGLPQGGALDEITGAFTWKPGYDQAGEYLVTFIATDNGTPALSDSQDIRITVNNVNLTPIADAGKDQIVLLGITVNFDGSKSGDPDGTIVSYLWDFGDGTTGSGAKISHLYDTGIIDTYNVILTVTDNDGASAEANINIVISDTISDIIIDNMDTDHTSRAGTWYASSSAPGYYGTNYHYCVAGTGTTKFNWMPAITTSGTYEVYARWTAGASRADNAKYTVTNHTGSTLPVEVNQKLNNGVWISLGQYSFTAGDTAKVTLDNNANGFVFADAVKLVYINEHVDIVVDNMDSNTSRAGIWYTSSSAPGYYGTNYQYCVAGIGTTKFNWMPAIAVSGTYEVFARWTAGPSRADNAKYTVTNHTGSTLPVEVNQKLNNGVWISLGQYSFTAGGTAQVTLDNNANGLVFADAVKFVWTD